MSTRSNNQSKFSGIFRPISRKCLIGNWYVVCYFFVGNHLIGEKNCKNYYSFRNWSLDLVNKMCKKIFNSNFCGKFCFWTFPTISLSNTWKLEFLRFWNLQVCKPFTLNNVVENQNEYEQFVYLFYYLFTDPLFCSKNIAKG